MKDNKRIYKAIYKINGHRFTLDYYKLFFRALQDNTEPFETVVQYIYEKYPKLYPLFNDKMFSALAHGYEVFEKDMFDFAYEEGWFD